MMSYPSDNRSLALCWWAAPLVIATLGLAASGCGRPAPQDALAGLGDDLDIAGVSVTSPDAVVAVDPAAPTAPAAQTGTETPPAPEGPTQKLYTIQDGDTMSKIASDHGIPIDDLAQANGITDVHSIRPGEELIIPIPAPVEVTIAETPTDESTTSSTP